MSRLESLYHNLCRTPSDINLLLPHLMEMVDNFPGIPGPRVTEMGTRHGWSTVALLMGCPQWLISYDIDPKPEDYEQIRQAWVDHTLRDEGLEFRKGNTLEVEIQETDILFIDTLHTGAQLSAELERHHGKVKHLIAMHDLTSYGLQDEAPVTMQGRNYVPGLVPAVFQFMMDHPEWKVEFYTPICNGLLILKRRVQL
jgi:predicted O-methyltransferase YrrM